MNPPGTTSAAPQIRLCTTSDGATIAWASSGTGAAVVKTPNWLNHVELDARSPVWRTWIERFGRDHRLVRYDARGCGLSSRGAAPLAFADNERDLLAVVDAAGLDRFVLYGASQGAAIAIDFAARHPERVSHLILCGAYLQGALRRDPSPPAVEEAQTMLKLIELGWGRANSAFRQVFVSQFIPDSTLEQQQGFDEIQRVTASPETAAQLLRLFYDIDVAEPAGRVRCPTLVLHSRDDARIPFAEGLRVAAAIPGAEFVPLDSRNHILLDHQAAWRRFFVEVASFLARHPVQRDPASGLPELTPGELRVLDLIAAGLGNAEIAARLGLREKTVGNHINHIFSKLHVADRARAIVLGRDAGLGRAIGAPPR